jgi:hypothetical protein
MTSSHAAPGQPGDGRGERQRQGQCGQHEVGGAADAAGWAASRARREHQHRQRRHHDGGQGQTQIGHAHQPAIPGCRRDHARGGRRRRCPDPRRTAAPAAHPRLTGAPLATSSLTVKSFCRNDGPRSPRAGACRDSAGTARQRLVQMVGGTQVGFHLGRQAALAVERVRPGPAAAGRTPRDDHPEGQQRPQQAGYRSLSGAKVSASTASGRVGVAGVVLPASETRGAPAGAPSPSTEAPPDRSAMPTASASRSSALRRVRSASALRGHARVSNAALA